jgi:hypothetical protein
MERTPSEMADLVVTAVFFQDLTPEEQEYLENWGNRSPRHRKLIEQAADPGWLKERFKKVNGRYP